MGDLAECVISGHCSVFLFEVDVRVQRKSGGYSKKMMRCSAEYDFGQDNRTNDRSRCS